jgi:hypothetical protein
MAKIILSGTMVRTPLGGLNLWHLAWLTGIKSLGHDIHFVEKSMWEYDCYDLSTKTMTNDCTYGITVVNDLFEKYDLTGKWCFVDQAGTYHGMSKKQVEQVFDTADVFIDFEWGEWQEESLRVPLRVFVDGEPGWFQMKLYDMITNGKTIPHYDYFFTDGKLSNPKYKGTTAGIHWHEYTPPAMIARHSATITNGHGTFSTVMNWKSNQDLLFKGKTYGQKNIEFRKFMDLPTKVREKMEVAVSGPEVPTNELMNNGWQVKNGDDVSVSVDSYLNYIQSSKGEFSVAKNVFVETHNAWFGDRPAYYMSFGKPVIVQETGWTDYYPSGEGLLAFKDINEAASAIEAVSNDYEKHSKRAREVAFDCFEAGMVLKNFLYKIGI